MWHVVMIKKSNGIHMTVYLLMVVSLLSRTNGNPSKNPLIMMLSENYDFNSFRVRWEIIFRNVGRSHGLWVASFYLFLGSGIHRVLGGF